MFKKKPTVKPLSPVRSSDRRKLADTIISNLSIPIPPSTEGDPNSGVAPLRASLLPPSTRTARFSTTHGPDLTPVHGTIYVGSPIASQDSRASWMSLSLPKQLHYTTAPTASGDVFIPTIYTLWRMPELLPIVRTHGPVIEKLLGGADLMVPGLIGPPWTEAKVGDIVAVEGDRKGAAMAVGILEVDLKDIERVQGEKGRAVKILHWWGDEVWKIGSGEEVAMPDGVEQGVEGVEALKVEDAVREEPASGGGDAKKDEGNVDDGTEAIRDLNTDEIDDAFHKAALYGLSTQAEKAGGIDFPLSSSAFMSDFVLPFLPPASSFPPFNLLQTSGPHPSLTLKKSSYKNATKFLKHLDKEQLIKTKVRGGGELVVLDCNWGSEAVTTFAPYKLPKPDAPGSTPSSSGPQNTTGADGDGEQKPKIKIAKLIYLPSPKLAPFFDEIGADKTTPQTASSLRALLLSHLSAHKAPRIPPSASPLLFSTLSITNPATREALLSSFIALCQPYHTFPSSPNPTKLYKGPPPKLTITIEKRQGNKSVTRVSGVEDLGIDPKMLAEKLSHKCAGAATVKQAVGKKVGVMEVQVQGKWDGVVKAMVEGWGVEKGVVEVVDKSGGKKK